MSGVIPNVAEALVLTQFTEDTLTLKLFGNNHTPAETDTASAYTEISGGGYADVDLAPGSWTITAGSPSIAAYAFQDFNFTGAIDAPGTVYGYFLVDSNGILRGAERFSASVVPFTPANGSLIRVTPKIQVS